MVALSLSILGQVIAEGSREDLTGSSKPLFELFLKLFDLRNESPLRPKVYLFWAANTGNEKA
jgi:hypothetical protein